MKYITASYPSCKGVRGIIRSITMKYKLIAIDLDGTLLSTDGDISDRNLDAVRDITEKGVLFVPVTGRAMYEIPKRVTECP